MKTTLLFVLSTVLLSSILGSVILANNHVYAHALPVTENLPPNSIIKKGEPLPSKIIIDFSERPDPSVSTIQVLNSKNERIDKGDFAIIGNHGRKAMTTLYSHKLTDGVYTVSWMTQSADDGHIARGSYAFGIGNIGPGAAGTTDISPSSSTTKTNLQQPQVIAVTSNLDGLIKWPLIVSQAAIVGGIFSHLFLWEQFGNKIARKNDDDGQSRDLHWLKRFTIMLVAASVTIVASASSSLFLQITELSGNSYYSYISIFTSILHGSSGIWLMHTATSIIVITCSVSFYYLSKRDNGKRIFQKNKPERVLSGRSPTSSLLYVALAAGALSIFANSISSHNAGVNFLPSLAISLDWLHFMAVSMWVGGLFYISAVLLATIRASSSVTPAMETEDLSQRTSPSNKASNIEKKMTETSDSATYHYYLALLLPRFSLIATVSLGIIGVSGIYMAWIQLQNINALFNTNYGNILIIKLAAALPLVLLGAYHQLRLHRSVVRVASSGRVGSTMQITQSFDHDSEDEPSKGAVGRKKEINNNSNSKKNDISKFDKTIKIESLLAISVLLVASLLTITSPHPMDMSHMGMMSSTSSSSSPSVMNMTGMQTSVKNSTYVKQVSIMNINTKIEINPFYTGFNIFKIAFTDANGKPYTKVSSAELIFRNEQKDIGPIVVNLHTVRPGIFSVGTFIPQPGEWSIAIAAQRHADYDLNYKFTAKVPNAPAPTSTETSQKTTTGEKPSSSPNANIIIDMNNNNNMQEPLPKFDSFAWLTIGLAISVGLFSTYNYKRSKQELRETIAMFEQRNAMQ